MKHVFVINPNSGDGDYKIIKSWIESNLSKHKIEYEILSTEYEGHAIELVNNIDDVNTVVYAVGGDGTINEVLNGLREGVTMGIIPAGSGNDFWRMMGYKGSIEKMLYDVIVDGVTLNVDTGTVNMRRFMNCANFGLDSVINNDVNESRAKWISRKYLYMIKAVKNIFNMRPVSYTLFTKDLSIDCVAILTSVMNGKWYGNGFKSAPNASIFDSHFDVCIVKPITIARALNLLPRYMTGKHLGIKEVTMLNLDNFVIEGKSPIMYSLDGEIFEAKKLEISLDPLSVKLRVPKNASIANG